MLRPILNASRFLVIAAVLGSLAASMALFAYGAAETVVVIAETVAKGEISSKGAKVLALSFIEIVDLFLLGTVLLMIGLGLYELFIDSNLKLPEWLQIRTFDDLKYKLVGVVIVVLAVMFLGHVVAWDGERELLGIGTAIALVIAALTYFLSGLPPARPGDASVEFSASAPPKSPQPRTPTLAIMPPVQRSLDRQRGGGQHEQDDRRDHGTDRG
jgi:uncharacterized membrane protein YqhA